MSDQELDEMLARSRPSLGTFRRLWPFMRPHRWLLLTPVLIELVFVVSWALGPHLLKIAIDDFIPTRVWIGAGICAALMALNSAFQSALAAGQRLWAWRACQNIINDIRKWLFGHIQELSIDFFDREKQGRIIARVDRDVDYLEDILSYMPIMVVHTAGTILAAGAMLYWYDWRLCLIVAGLCPVVVVAAYASQRWGLPAYRRVRRSISHLTSNLAENVSGVQVVQAFGREDRNLGVFQALLSEFREHAIAGARVRGITFPGMFLAFGLAYAAVIAYAGYAVPRGHMTIGEIPAAIMYINMIYGPLTMLAHMYDEVLAASAASERLVELMEKKPTIVDGPGALDIPAIQGHVQFEHVCFRYDPQPDTPWILEDVSFEARPGEIVALVGPTGAGKTSVVNLLPRFYEVRQGRILIDGHDIRHVTQRSLHRQMGIVLQENFLFTGTVMDNLKYGRPNATDEEAVAAAKALGSHALIESLANGYQTDVRERGGAISHGERQLICFTRAMIADPRILILDEATSSVDTETERLIQNALWKLMEGRTTFVVAHRLSTVRHAHTILVVQDGRILERGSHDELMALGRTYAAMFEEFVRGA